MPSHLELVEYSSFLQLLDECLPNKTCGALREGEAWSVGASDRTHAQASMCVGGGSNGYLLTCEETGFGRSEAETSFRNSRSSQLLSLDDRSSI